MKSYPNSLQCVRVIGNFIREFRGLFSRRPDSIRPGCKDGGDRSM